MAIDTEPSSGTKVTVLDPTGYPPKINRKQLAPRLEGLDGKTIYLVDCRFDDAGAFLAEVERWFNENMPSVTTKLVEKNGVYGRDDPETWEEIKAHGDAAIVGVGH